MYLNWVQMTATHISHRLSVVVLFEWDLLFLLISLRTSWLEKMHWEFQKQNGSFGTPADAMSNSLFYLVSSLLQMQMVVLY